MPMLRFIIICSYIFLGALGFSQTSSITFVIKNFGVNVDGQFKTFAIDAQFDSAQQLNSLSATVDVVSVDTGIDSRDEHLLEADYFHTNKFEHITLESTAIQKINPKQYSVNANLKIKGYSKPIHFIITLEKDSNSCKITSNTK